MWGKPWIRESRFSISAWTPALVIRAVDSKTIDAESPRRCGARTAVVAVVGRADARADHVGGDQRNDPPHDYDSTVGDAPPRQRYHCDLPVLAVRVSLIGRKA
jgi:hypothetical protein